jgi:hypothetical protein
MNRQFVVSAKILPLPASKAYCGALQSIAVHRKFKAVGFGPPVMSDQVSTLYLKWRFFRDLLQMPQSDREIAIAYWGPNEGPSKFSKMLKGDLGFPPDAADMLASVINRRIEVHAGAKSGSIGAPLRGGDLYLPLFEFAAKVVAAGGPISPDSLERAHRGLLEQLVPVPPQDGPALRLMVERFTTDRSFEGFRGANEGPIEFEIGKHLGQISIEGDMIAQIKEAPLVYASVTRDPSPSGWLWEGRFDDSFMWLPSPFPPKIDGKRLQILPEPTPLRPIPGRYRATAIIVFDRTLIGKLDPRAEKVAVPSPGRLDEARTARLLTNLSRMMQRDSSGLSVVTAEYIVKPSTAGA